MQWKAQSGGKSPISHARPSSDRGALFKPISTSLFLPRAATLFAIPLPPQHQPVGSVSTILIGFGLVDLKVIIKKTTHKLSSAGANAEPQ